MRVEDQVQNQAMFLSDGIVVDLKQPKVTLRGIDSEKYYTEDIPFSITVEDFHLKNQILYQIFRHHTIRKQHKKCY